MVRRHRAAVGASRDPRGWGGLGDVEPNARRTAGQDVLHRSPERPQAEGRREFDPPDSDHVPLGGRIRCRRVPHVHGQPPQAEPTGSIAGFGRGRAVPGRHAACPSASWRVRGRRQSISCRRRAGWTVLETNGESREQAYVSAEQPTPSPHARFPPAHAHPRRSRHLGVAPSQGPQEPRRLSHRVLPRSHRLTDGESFRRTTRRGRRSASATVVVHLSLDASVGEPRVGFVVGRSVGSAVVRNRTRRRLRHLVRERLADLPAGSSLVVRALPAAAGASSSHLGRDLDRCLNRSTGPARR